MAIKVTLRKKPLKNGKLSLYLDFYPPIIRNGKSTRREFLGFSIYENPKGQIEKQHNKNIEAIAEEIATKSVVLHDFVDFKYNYFSFDFSIS